MKKVFVFCIGGTGIRVMKSITMLMAGGMDTSGYVVVPVIIDPHRDLEEKKNLDTLIETYRKIHRYSINNGSQTLSPLPGFFGSVVRTITELDGQGGSAQESVGSNEKFRSYIGLANLGTDDINNLLVETLFSTKNLNNPLSVGFKGNPNVGTVVLGEMIEGAEWFNAFKRHCEDGDRVFIISSIFGGTGASGYPLIENKIRLAEDMPAVKNAIMGAVTVLPYYGLKDPATTGSDIDSANFYTKTKSALAYYHGTVKSDYLYYVGETSLARTVYDNDENKQDDKTHFIELVAASALFDFLKRGKPDNRQFLSRAIDDDSESLDLLSMGEGYKPLVKSVADFMLLRLLVDTLPDEKFFPLKKNMSFNQSFYEDAEFNSLKDFCKRYNDWYKELSNNTRAFAPLYIDKPKEMSGWIKTIALDAKNDSYYLLEMIKASNKYKKDHDNKFRFFLQFAYEAIDKYTKKIYK